MMNMETKRKEKFSMHEFNSTLQVLERDYRILTSREGIEIILKNEKLKRFLLFYGRVSVVGAGQV